MHIRYFELFGNALAGIYSVVHSYGLAIILLTVLTRVIMLPLSIKQTRSMREMQRVQPEVKKIQAKYKGDKQKMNQEMMALYKEHGVNPFGGCLPLLMQLPVLIALFRVLRNPLAYMGSTLLAADLTGKGLAVQHFLGIRLDCTAQLTLRHAAPPSILNPDLPGTVCGGTIVSALPYLVLVLAMGLSTWYQQKQMQASSTAPDGQQAQQMQAFAKIMPAMLMFFAFTFPSGLVVYWLTTNVWTIAQQRIMLAKAPPLAAPANGKVKPAAKELKKPAPPAAKKTSANGGRAPGSGPAQPAASNGSPRPKQTAASKPSSNAKKKKKR
jgi:YidC/Oxa1 family membrane protein insertase